MENQLHLRSVKFTKDAYITVEGEQNADQFYIIHEGKVRVSRDVQVVAEERGNILGPGDFFGVISTMSGHSHIDTSRALTNVVLVAVHRDQYSRLIQANAPVAKKILLEFSRRMRFLNENLTRISLKKSADVNVDHLFTVAEYYTKQRHFNFAHYVYTQYLKHCPNGEHVSAASNKLKRIASYVKNANVSFTQDEMTRTYLKDTMIFSEGEPGEEVFIIKNGYVKISKVVEDGEVLLAVLKAGDVFGEMALLESRPRGASAIAYETCELMTVNRSNFHQMIATQPQLITRMTEMLAERIWLSYKQLANTRITDPLGRIYDMLLSQLEKRHVDLNDRHAFQLDFGIMELVSMVGFAYGEGKALIQKLLQNRSIKIIQEKICVENVLEFSRQAAYYRKSQDMDKSRRKF